MKHGRRIGSTVLPKVASMGGAVKAAMRRAAGVRNAMVGIYIIAPVFDRRDVLWGNQPLERVLIGMTTNPSATKAKAKQFGLGFDNRMFVWWVSGKANAERIMKRLDPILDPAGDDPALGSWFSVGLEHAKREIAITAHCCNVAVEDTKQWHARRDAEIGRKPKRR